MLTVLDKELTGKKYLVDNTFTAADIMIGYILMWFPEHIEKFTNLKTYTQNLQDRPAYIRSKED